MRVLVIGGTAFVGRHVTEALVARDHQLTLFHRGLTDPDRFTGVEHIIGDRDRDIGRLSGRRFDVVIDTCGYEVPAVRAAVQAVAHSELHYIFISSVSVYSDLSRMDESGPVQKFAGAESATLAPDNYGALKAACERVVTDALPGRSQVIRAGLILGPHDYDERFAWWLGRLARGGEVLAPGDPAAPVQFIDVRDLARWIALSAEARVAGTFNATGPGEPTTMASLLTTMREEIGSDARFTWVSDDILLADSVAPYSEMPFWLPASLGYRPADTSRATRAGLTHRPFAETVRDTWAWMASGLETAERARAHRRLRVPAGLSPDREARLLARARAL